MELGDSLPLNIIIIVVGTKVEENHHKDEKFFMLNLKFIWMFCFCCCCCLESFLFYFGTFMRNSTNLDGDCLLFLKRLKLIGIISFRFNQNELRSLSRKSVSEKIEIKGFWEFFGTCLVTDWSFWNKKQKEICKGKKSPGFHFLKSF